MDKKLVQEIASILLQYCDDNYLNHTRVHPLSSFSNEALNVFVKREDETSFGVSGSKGRKYASLLPFLRENNYTEVVLIGGPQSNHIAAMLQVLNEHNIKAHLFLKEPHSPKIILRGNGLLRFLLADEKLIHWIKTEAWGEAESLAKSFIAHRKKDIYLIPEGGSCQPSVAGACSLMLDIQRNEEKMDTIFDHIWIDSGTALMAGCLVLMNALLKKKTHVHIVLNAGNETYFQEQLQKQKVWLENLYQVQIPKISNYSLYFSSTARAFGSVNRTILDYIKEMAQTEGILLDPIYTAKLFYTAKYHISRRKLAQNILIIHSGGGTGLMGFGDRFSNLMDTK